jgi:hypothetical protein
MKDFAENFKTGTPYRNLKKVYEKGRVHNYMASAQTGPNTLHHDTRHPISKALALHGTHIMKEGAART